MAVEIRIPTKNGVTLNTKNKYVKENLNILLDSSLIPQGTLEVTENGEHDVASYEKVNVAVAGSGESTLKKLLDVTKSTYHFFYQKTSLTDADIEGLIDYNDTENVKNMEAMFNQCSKLTTIPLFNTSNVENINNMFSQCSALTTLPLFDFKKLRGAGYVFNSCTSLETIPAWDVRVCTGFNWFYNCKKLKTILMYGMKYNIDISPSTQFEASDLVVIISNCQVVTSSPKITMGSTNLAKLENVYVKETGVELYEGITCRPCVICESTDEGAMLVTTYATNKGWTLA